MLNAERSDRGKERKYSSDTDSQSSSDVDADECSEDESLGEGDLKSYQPFTAEEAENILPVPHEFQKLFDEFIAKNPFTLDKAPMDGTSLSTEKQEEIESFYTKRFIAFIKELHKLDKEKSKHATTQPVMKNLKNCRVKINELNVGGKYEFSLQIIIQGQPEADLMSIDELATTLREYYLTKHAELPKLLNQTPQPMEQCYVHLAIIKKLSKQQEKDTLEGTQDSAEGTSQASHESQAQGTIRDERIHTYEALYNQSEPIQLDALFTPDQPEKPSERPTPIHRILITGRAGIGKSTLCQKMAYDWAKGGLWQAEFSCVYWVSLKQWNQKGNKDALKQAIQETQHSATPTQALLARAIRMNWKTSYPDERVPSIASIESSLHDKRTLLILDGFDEIAHLESSESRVGKVLKAALQHPRLIVTARPYGIPQSVSFDRKVENMGFNNEHISHYVQHMAAFYHGYRQRLLPAGANRDTYQKKRGIYLYRQEGEEGGDVYAQVVHTKKRKDNKQEKPVERLNLSELLPEDKAYLLNSLRWPKKKSVPIRLKPGLLKVIEEHCDHPAYFEERKATIKSLADAFYALLKKNSNLWGLAHIPLNMNLLCQLRFDKSFDFDFGAHTTLTQIYAAMEEQILKRYLRRNAYVTAPKKRDAVLESDFDISDTVCEAGIIFLERLAMEGIKKEQLFMDKTIINRIAKETKLYCNHYNSNDKSNPITFPELGVTKLALDMGFIKNIGKHRDRRCQYYFIHLTFQEYFAAKYLVRGLQQVDTGGDYFQAVLKFIEDEKYRPEYRMVFSFVSGLVSLSSREEALKYFWDAILCSPQDLVGLQKVDLWLSCLEDAKRPGESSIDKRIKKKNDMINELKQWVKVWLNNERLPFLETIFLEHPNMWEPLELCDRITAKLDDKNETVSIRDIKILKSLAKSSSDQIFNNEILIFALQNILKNNKDDNIRLNTFGIINVLAISDPKRVLDDERLMSELEKALDDKVNKISRGALYILVEKLYIFFPENIFFDDKGLRIKLEKMMMVENEKEFRNRVSLFPSMLYESNPKQILTDEKLIAKLLKMFEDREKLVRDAALRDVSTLIESCPKQVLRNKVLMTKVKNSLEDISERGCRIQSNVSNIDILNIFAASLHEPDFDDTVLMEKLITLLDTEKDFNVCLRIFRILLKLNPELVLNSKILMSKLQNWFGNKEKWGFHIIAYDILHVIAKLFPDLIFTREELMRPLQDGLVDRDSWLICKRSFGILYTLASLCPKKVVENNILVSEIQKNMSGKSKYKYIFKIAQKIFKVISFSLIAEERITVSNLFLKNIVKSLFKFNGSIWVVISYPYFRLQLGQQTSSNYHISPDPVQKKINFIVTLFCNQAKKLSLPLYMYEPLPEHDIKSKIRQVNTSNDNIIPIFTLKRVKEGEADSSKAKSAVYLEPLSKLLDNNEDEDYKFTLCRPNSKTLIISLTNTNNLEATRDEIRTALTVLVRDNLKKDIEGLGLTVGKRKAIQTSYDWDNYNLTIKGSTTSDINRVVALLQKGAELSLESPMTMLQAAFFKAVDESYDPSSEEAKYECLTM